MVTNDAYSLTDHTPWDHLLQTGPIEFLCSSEPASMSDDFKTEIRDATREAFGSALRQAREETKLSQEKFADKVGLDRTTISLLERGRQSATVETVWILSGGLKDSPSQLLARTQRLMR